MTVFGGEWVQIH